MIDVAGSGGVHVVGGVAGLVATLMLGPRLKRFDKTFDTSPGNATNMIVGMFMLWYDLRVRTVNFLIEDALDPVQSAVK